MEIRLTNIALTILRAWASVSSLSSFSFPRSAARHPLAIIRKFTALPSLILKRDQYFRSRAPSTFFWTSTSSRLSHFAIVLTTRAAARKSLAEGVWRWFGGLMLVLSYQSFHGEDAAFPRFLPIWWGFGSATMLTSDKNWTKEICQWDAPGETVTVLRAYAQYKCRLIVRYSLKRNKNNWLPAEKSVL